MQDEKWERLTSNSACARLRQVQLWDKIKPRSKQVLKPRLSKSTTSFQASKFNKNKPKASSECPRSTNAAWEAKVHLTDFWRSSVIPDTQRHKKVWGGTTYFFRWFQWVSFRGYCTRFWLFSTKTKPKICVRYPTGCEPCTDPQKAALQDKNENDWPNSACARSVNKLPSSQHKQSQGKFQWEWVT